MNTVAEIGRLTKDVELKQTTGGKTYGRFTLAVNRRYKNSNGTYDADYFNCVVWGLTAENLAKFTKKRFVDWSFRNAAKSQLRQRRT